MKNLYKYRDYLIDSPLLKALQTWKFTTLLLVVLSLQGYDTIAQSAKRKVTGQVTSAVDNQGIPGVSVIIKGTNTGAATDIDGNFAIEAGEEDVLVVSYIGYHSQEVPVGAKTKLDISLVEDITKLSEVVVVGYGEVKRSDLTSAQTTITAKEIQSTINTTIDQAIQGRAAGVYVTQNSGQPGGGISVNIRGINSITGSNEPLYVIDGVQLQPGTVAYGGRSSTNPLASLNPADIESMEILQGPSATAVYGSRGTNGVVLITTKRGKAGEMKVNYGFLYTIQEKPKFLPTLNLQQYATMYNEIRQFTGNTPTPEFYDPSILGEGTNWQDALFVKAPLKKHQLSLSGGNEKTTFYLSGEYFDQAGVAIGSSFDRYSVRLNVDNQTRKWLKISTNLGLSQTSEELSTSQSDIITNALQMPPYIGITNGNGDWGGPDNTNGGNNFTPLNPIALANLIENQYTRRSIIGGLNIEVKLLKGLVFRNSFSGNIGLNSSMYWEPSYRIGNVPAKPASLERRSETNWYWNWNQLLQYNNRIGKHDFEVMASHEAQESFWENLVGSRSGFVTNDIKDLTAGDANGQQNGSERGDWGMESYLGRARYTFNDKYIVQGAFRADGSANFGSNNRWGFFPSVSAAWNISKEAFMKNITVIDDLKLRLETGLTGNQGNSSWYAPLQNRANALGVSFLASKYGNPDLQWEETKTNNIGFNLSLLKNRIQLEGDFYVKKTDNLLMPNPLPWYMGTTGQGSIAPPPVNIGSLENKGYAISLNTVNIDRNGFSWRSNFNVSGFKTKILKFNTETAVIDRTSWWMDGWLQRSAVGAAPWLMRGYEVEGLFQSQAEIEASAIPADLGVKIPIDRYDGVWVGDYKYKDQPTVDTNGDGIADSGDGVIDEKDITTIGNPWPKMTFGFTNTFTYKGFDLSILLTGAYGNDVYNYVRFRNTDPNQINIGRNLLAETFDYAKVEGEGNAAHLTNPGTNIPRISGNDANGNHDRFNNWYVEDGSYIRIKNIQLGYNLPKSLLSKLKVIQNVRLTLGAQNLHTFTKYKGMDPEVGAYIGNNVSAENQAIGIDAGRYPSTRMYSFSIGVDF